MRRDGERGQVLVLFALAMSLFLVILVFGIADLSYELVAWSQISQDTFLGARSGASSLNQLDLQNGGSFTLTTGVGSNSATALCFQYVNRNISRIPGKEISHVKCSVSGGEYVTARAKVQLKLPFPSFVPDTVSSSSTAQLQHGVNTPVN
jgi:hypothetical protein